MDKNVLGILIVVFVLVNTIRWWLISKGSPYRKYILSTVICLVISAITYWVGMTFDIWQLVLICVISFFATFFFGIKSLIAERKFKNTSHD